MYRVPFNLNQAQSAHCCTLYFLPSQNDQLTIQKKNTLLALVCIFCEDILLCAVKYITEISINKMPFMQLYPILSRHSIILVKIIDPKSSVVNL